MLTDRDLNPVSDAACSLAAPCDAASLKSIASPKRSWQRTALYGHVASQESLPPATEIGIKSQSFAVKVKVMQHAGLLTETYRTVDAISGHSDAPLQLQFTAQGEKPLFDFLLTCGQVDILVVQEDARARASCHPPSSQEYRSV